MPYELVVDGAVRDLGEVAYLLSPEDLEASALVLELVKLGVSSLKLRRKIVYDRLRDRFEALYG